MFYLITILIIALLFVKSKKSLHMLQQNLYNENNRYIKWNLKHCSQFLNIEIIAILLSAIGLFVVYDLRLYNFIIELALKIIYLISFILWKNHLKNEQTKKPLVYTKRIKRLILTTSIIYLIPIILMFLHKNDIEYVWLMILILAIATYLNALIVFVANIINYPIERMVYIYYKNKAQKKLKSMPNLKIIGITGSYGKTSSKNILSDILKIKYNALPNTINLNY